MNALEVKELCKHYPGFALENVSFTVPQGAIMGFVGRNGAGKTTTLKSLLGLVHPDGGEVRLFGQDYFADIARYKPQLGIVLGGADYYRTKKLRTIASVTASFYPGLWAQERYRRYLTLFELDENKCISELSAGMCVKFSLALALSHEARLLILDEPTSGLDPVSRDELCRLFTALTASGERSILFSTHITSDLEKCATHITMIRDGVILNSLPKAEFLAAYAGATGLGEAPTLEEILISAEGRRYDAQSFAD